MISLWMEQYKQQHLHENSTPSKWLILQNDKGLYYKKELDNIDFGHAPVGFILYPYEIAINLVDLLNDQYDLDFKWEEVCNNEAMYKIKNPVHLGCIYFKKCPKDVYAYVWVGNKKQWMSSAVLNSALNNPKLFIKREVK